MDFLEDDLGLNLALLGCSPDLIEETMAATSREYADYRRWLPAENTSAKDTLLWEAAKHCWGADRPQNECLFHVALRKSASRKTRRRIGP
jgi:hypothetical protein